MENNTPTAAKETEEETKATTWMHPNDWA